MCLNNIYELGSKLCELLSTLKKNREYVPLEILQTQYRVPYETLKKQIGDTATAFVKEITLSKLMINPDVSLEEQISVIQQAITTSGMLKEMSYTLSKLYDVELLHRQALKLRTYIEDAVVLRLVSIKEKEMMGVSLKRCIVTIPTVIARSENALHISLEKKQ